MHNYRELKVWQRAMAFTIVVYRTTQSWPPDKRFGLGYLSSPAAAELLKEADEIAAMLVGLMRSLNSKRS